MTTKNSRENERAPPLTVRFYGRRPQEGDARAKMKGSEGRRSPVLSGGKALQAQGTQMQRPRYGTAPAVSKGPEKVVCWVRKSEERQGGQVGERGQKSEGGGSFQSTQRTPAFTVRWRPLKFQVIPVSFKPRKGTNLH